MNNVAKAALAIMATLATLAPQAVQAANLRDLLRTAATEYTYRNQGYNNNGGYYGNNYNSYHSNNYNHGYYNNNLNYNRRNYGYGRHNGYGYGYNGLGPNAVQTPNGSYVDGTVDQSGMPAWAGGWRPGQR